MSVGASKPSTGFDLVDEDRENPESPAWPLGVPGDDDWYWYAPSDAGKALRVGLDWLLDNEFTKFAELPKTALNPGGAALDGART